MTGVNVAETIEAPMNWAARKFAECATLVNGRAYSQEELLAAGTHKVIRIQNLNGGGKWYYSDIELPEEKYCTAGDLLFAWSASFGPYIWSGPKAIFHYHIWKVIPREGVLDREFAYFLLRWMTDEIRQGAHGVAMLHFTKENMEDYEIRIPDIHHQRLIACHLKARLAAQNRAQQATAAQLVDVTAFARRFRQTTLQRLSTAKRVELGCLLEGIDAGRSFQTSERLATPQELGVLKVSAISWGRFNPQEAKAVDARYVPEDNHRIRAGDVIVSRANTIELVGAIVKAEHDYPTRLLSDKTWRLLLDRSRCDADYLVMALRLPEARAHIEANATGTSDSMRNISQAAFGATPIPLPSIEEQCLLTEKVKRVEELLERARKAIDDSLEELGRLDGKMLASAFQ